MIKFFIGQNAAFPRPSRLSPQFAAAPASVPATFDLQAPITVGGRADGHADRHFEGLNLEVGGGSPTHPTIEVAERRRGRGSR